MQLSTLDWRLLRSTDFYLQVVPFSTRCPRLALKCLAPGGRNVQEVLVPESQHPLVFTTEWLHSVNKERGCKRDGEDGGSGFTLCPKLPEAVGAVRCNALLLLTLEPFDL